MSNLLESTGIERSSALELGPVAGSHFDIDVAFDLLDVLAKFRDEPADRTAEKLGVEDLIDKMTTGETTDPDDLAFFFDQIEGAFNEEAPVFTYFGQHHNGGSFGFWPHYKDIEIAFSEGDVAFLSDLSGIGAANYYLVGGEWIEGELYLFDSFLIRSSDRHILWEFGT